MGETKVFERVRWGVRRRWHQLTAHSSPIILLYHRISDTCLDPSHLSITEGNFSEQIEALCRIRQVVPLDEVLKADTGRRRGKPLAAITFDDGYRSVITKALPILKAHRCPSTLFVCPGMIDSPREFWWDELARIVFEQPLPSQLSLPTAGGNRVRQTGHLTGFPSMLSLYDEMWAAFLPMKPDRRILAIDDLARQAGAQLERRDEFRVASGADLASLAGSGMEIGAHTVSHPSLPILDREDQEREIAESLEFCRAYSRGKAVHFSYPFGYHDDATVDLVRRTGFASAVTTVQGIVRKGTDRMLLPRYTIHDCGAAKFKRSLP